MTKKLLKNQKGELGVVGMVIIAVLAILVAVVAYPAIFPATPGTDSSGDETDADTPTGKMFQADATLKLKNWNGGSAIASDTSVSVYLIPPDQYASIYEARQDLSEEGGLVSPYNADEFASSDTPDANGEVQLTARALSEENGGTDYGIYVHDSTTETSSPGQTAPTANFGDLLSKVKLEGHYDSAGAQVVSSLITTGYVGPDITLANVGNISVYDNQNGVYNRTIFARDYAANASVTEQSVDFHVRLNNNYARAFDIGMYVEELDSVAGTGTMDINEIILTLPDGTKKTVSLKKVSDYPSISPIQKNAPSANASGTSTMWFASWEGENGEIDEGFDLQRISSTRYEEVVVSFTDLDFDFSAATTTDKADIKLHFSSWNGYKDSDMQLYAFTSSHGETLTAGWTT